MRILMVEPYDTGSHAAWMRGYQLHSAHEVRLLSLDGHYWQWRMLGGAVTLAERFLALEWAPDLIVASDMLDLAGFLALTRPVTARTPTAVYFHENQLTYPAYPRQKLQQHYAFSNYLSALVADAVYFNSAYHHDVFFDELPRLLRHFPDHNNLPTIDRLRARSAVLPLGLDLQRFDAHRPAAARDPVGPRLVLWNHRWDHDKNPRPFFEALFRLADEGVPFEVAMVGENTRHSAPDFDAARERLGVRVVRFGSADSVAEYARLLWQVHVVVSTSNQDFFGVSVSEAIYCGAWPLLARRLNYPALVPLAWHAGTLFDDDAALVDPLRARLLDPRPAPPDLRAHVAAYDWHVMAPRYDAAFADLAASK